MSARVLIVEDDPDLRGLLKTMLATEGLEVDEAPHGKAALDSMERRRPDLILLDMRMPIMDGWAFCRELDRRGDRPKVIVLTAAADPAERAAEVRADAWLGKPFEYQALLSAVERVLNEAPMARRPGLYR